MCTEIACIEWFGVPVIRNLTTEALVPASTMTWSSLDDCMVTQCNSCVMKTYPLGSWVVDGGYS